MHQSLLKNGSFHVKISKPAVNQICLQYHINTQLSFKGPEQRKPMVALILTKLESHLDDILSTEQMEAEMGYVLQG